MSLSDRLERARGVHRAPGLTETGIDTDTNPAAEVEQTVETTETVDPSVATTKRPYRPNSTRRTWAALAGDPEPAPVADALADLKERAAQELFRRIGSRLNDPSLTEDKLRALVLGELDEVVEEEKVPLTSRGAGPAHRRARRRRARLRPAAAAARRPDGHRDHGQRTDQIYVERHGKLYRIRRPLHLRGAPAPGHRAHRVRASAGASTSPRRWWTPASPTAPASTRSSRRWPSAARR